MDKAKAKVTAKERKAGFKVLSGLEFRRFEAQSRANLKALDKMRSEIIRLRGAEECAETAIYILKAARGKLERELCSLADKLGFGGDLFEFPKRGNGRGK